jgi:hypothetical protein
MKATDIDDITIQKSHCDWIIEQAKELKALFSYNSKSMIELNKTRALADIEAIKNSLVELELYIENVTTDSKRDKVKKIIIRGLGGVWSGSQETFEMVVDNIYEKLKDVPDDYHKLLIAYIRL